MLEFDDTATTGPGERGEIMMAAKDGMGNLDCRGDNASGVGGPGVSYVECVLLAGAIILLLAILAHYLLQSAPVQHIVSSLCLATGKGSC